MSQYTVSIEFLDAGLVSQEPPRADNPMEQNIRVVESIENLQRGFTLKAPGRPDYHLTQEETNRLLELCSQITVSAPWRGQFGFDGMISTLALHSTRSHMVFSWWGDAPPEWQSAGAVFEYVMRIYGK